jgi:hypothetical protein
MTRPHTTARLLLGASLTLGALGCAAPTRAPEQATPEPAASPGPSPETPPAPPNEPEPPLEPTDPADDPAGHDMKQSTREEIAIVPLDRRPEGVDCDRCAHVMIGTQGGTKHRCQKANPAFADDPSAERRLSCDARCCPDME